MSKFAVERIESIVGSIKIYKLIVDGKCAYDDFLSEIEKAGNMSSDMKSMFRILDSVANGEKLPGDKFHQLRDCIHGYETKKNSLRFYLLKTEIGYIVFSGSKKTDQKAAISKFQKDHKEYLKTLSK